MIWTDGSSYDGEWERGIQHGMGKMSFPDGTEKEGVFQDNVYRGPKNPNDEEEIVNPKLLSRPSFVFKKTMKGSESQQSTTFPKVNSGQSSNKNFSPKN